MAGRNAHEGAIRVKVRFMIQRGRGNEGKQKAANFQGAPKTSAWISCADTEAMLEKRAH